MRREWEIRPGDSLALYAQGPEVRVATTAVSRSDLLADLDQIETEAMRGGFGAAGDDPLSPTEVIREIRQRLELERP